MFVKMLAFGKNIDLGFDTGVLREQGKRYAKIAQEIRDMAKDLDTCLEQLAADGWSTPAGTAFHEMTKTNWQENMAKYADLLDTYQKVLESAAQEYEDLVTDHIEKTCLRS